MRVIESSRIARAVELAAVKANTRLRPDVLKLINLSLSKEKSIPARKNLKLLIDNARLAAKNSVAICQDTGLVIILIEQGKGVVVKGDLYKALQQGIEKAYTQAGFRASVVQDPLRRKIVVKFTPASVHIRLVNGSRLKISLLVKGFGSENKSKLKMFNPTASADEIADWVVGSVKEAGADACPPYIVGLGIGATSDEALLTAKEALLTDLVKKTKDLSIFKLEQNILKKINSLNIGPFGMGGKTTALAVKIKILPTHIAGLPVGLNLSCHALRSASIII